MHSTFGRAIMALPFLLLLLAAGNCRAEALAEMDPTRGWHGQEFADATLAWVKKEYPDLKVRSGFDTFKLYGMTEDRSSVARLSGRIPDRLKQIITPGETLSLLGFLGGGGRIEVAGGTEILEHSLRDWILSQPENSVAPHVLLGKAIGESKGDVLRALTALWNITSRNWVAAPGRPANQITAKLMDPTGEAALADGAGRFVILPPGSGRAANDLTKRVKFVISKRGDKFSTYYHFIGTTLFSHYVAAKNNSPRLGDWLSTTGAEIESIFFRSTSGLPGERAKRVWNDLQGANAGARLYEATIDPGLGNSSLSKNLDVTSYLKPSPEFSGSYPLEADGRPPAYYRSDADPKFWSGPMSEEELKIRFTYATEENAQIFDPVLLATTSDGERLERGLARYLESGARDPELNSLIASFHAGKQGTKSKIPPVDFALELPLNDVHVKPGFPDYDLSESRRRVDRLIQTISDRVGQRGSISCKESFQQLSP